MFRIAIVFVVVGMAAEGREVPTFALRPYFEANAGRSEVLDHLGIRFITRCANLDLGFAPGRIYVHAKRWQEVELGRRHEMRVSGGALFFFEVGVKSCCPEGRDPLGGQSSFFRGADVRGWETGIPHYGGILYSQVYRGIDLVFFFDQKNRLTYEFHVEPGADPSQINLCFQSVETIRPLEEGGMEIVTAAGSLEDSNLLCYQESVEGRDPVAGTYRQTGSTSYGFEISRKYDSSRTLVIDPTLAYSSYWCVGQFRTAVVDGEGNLYLAGGAGLDFPVTPGAYDTTHNSPSYSDVAVTKIDSAGKVLWSTFLGGAEEDYAYVSAVNEKGELYVSGRAGVGFPTTAGAYDRSFNGGTANPVHTAADAFITKLSADGSHLLYSTYLGGRGQDIGRGIHLLPTGELVISANTQSPDFPTTPGVILQRNPGGTSHGYVSKISADGSDLVFSTYLGTTNASNEFIFAVAEDDRGNYWFAGSTTGTDWGDLSVTPDAFQPKRGGGKNDLYLGKISPDGKKLLYLTWLGGSDVEWIETEGCNDKEGNFYITGQTKSSDFPTTAGAYQREKKGFSDAFLVKFRPDGTLAVSTLFGGDSTADETFWGPVVGPAGRVWCAGLFRSDRLATPGAFQMKHRGEGDAFLAVFDADLKTYIYGSYIGGRGHEKGRFVAVAPDGSAAYVVGHTSSPDFPQVKPPQSPEIKQFMAFVAKFDVSDL